MDGRCSQGTPIQGGKAQLGRRWRYGTQVYVYILYILYIFIYLFVFSLLSLFIYLFIILWLIKHGGPSKKHVFSVLIHGLKWSFSPDLLVTYAESQEIPSIPSPAAHLAGQPVTWAGKSMGSRFLWRFIAGKIIEDGRTSLAMFEYRRVDDEWLYHLSWSCFACFFVVFRLFANGDLNDDHSSIPLQSRTHISAYQIPECILYVESCRCSFCGCASNVLGHTNNRKPGRKAIVNAGSIKQI